MAWLSKYTPALTAGESVKGAHDVVSRYGQRRIDSVQTG